MYAWIKKEILCDQYLRILIKSRQTIRYFTMKAF